jgi:hypothetical protein
MPVHPVEDCPHNDTFRHISETLNRLDRHTERSAIAMEEMAAQSAIIRNHEARLTEQHKNINEAFVRIRTLEDTTVSDEEFQKVRHKVSKLELRHARESGVEMVEEKHEKFWDDMKCKSTPFAFTFMFLLLWLSDKFNVFQNIAKWLKEMKG